MSMPYGKIYCDSCDYRGATLVMWGIFKYHFEDGHETYVDRDLGWCADCGGVRSVERLPDRVEVENELGDVRRRLLLLAAGSLVGRIALAFSRKRRSELSELQERKKDLEHIEAMLLSRTVPARCLECSSTSILRLPIYPHEEKIYDHPIGIDHPGCGGGLHIKDSGGLRLALALKHRTYDATGKLIAVEES